MAMIGYARVSTTDQNPEAQAARLRDRGCTWVFTDHGVTGRLASRPQWDACRAFLRDGDVLVVTRLDRIGRSVGNLVSVAGELHQRGVDLIALDQAIDTSAPAGRMLFHVLAAIAEFEHDLIAERTRDGLAAARARRGGTLPKRGPSISADKLSAARAALRARGHARPADRRGCRDLPRQLVPCAAARRPRALTRPWHVGGGSAAGDCRSYARDRLAAQFSARGPGADATGPTAGYGRLSRSLLRPSRQAEDQ